MQVQRSLPAILLGVVALMFSTILIGNDSQGETRMVTLTTSLGVIELQLDAGNAPDTVSNFIAYVEGGHYDGILFHRVIPNFMIQGGGMRAGLVENPALAPIENEADNGLKNLRGTIAMARTQDPHSATAQFFINLKDNSFLDHTEKSLSGWGYAVFGQVISGMDVVDQIALVETGSVGHHEDVPISDVIVKHARLRDQQ
jgi:peptidyl-prolyl cis-trans isomerase B (cyclophilin B)